MNLIHVITCCYFLKTLDKCTVAVCGMNELCKFCAVLANALDAVLVSILYVVGVFGRECVCKYMGT
jgi:hypothetical protein